MTKHREPDRTPVTERQGSARRPPKALEDLDLAGHAGTPESVAERPESAAQSDRRYLEDRPPHHEPT